MSANCAGAFESDMRILPETSPLWSSSASPNGPVSATSPLRGSDVKLTSFRTIEPVGRSEPMLSNSMAVKLS